MLRKKESPAAVAMKTEERHTASEMSAYPPFGSEDRQRECSVHPYTHQRLSLENSGLTRQREGAVEALDGHV